MKLPYRRMPVRWRNRETTRPTSLWSMEGDSEPHLLGPSLALSISIQSVLRQLDGLKARLEKHILRLIRELGWEADYHYCRSVPGIGVDNATALTAAYHRGAFAGADAFVAYLGLDVRVRESGTYKGQSKLSKRGEPELRRLLYCAARGATSHWRFADYRQRRSTRVCPRSPPTSSWAANWPGSRLL